MAKNFGGKFSPDSAGQDVTRLKKSKKFKPSFRSRLMFIAPLPLILTGFGQISGGNPQGILRDFGAFAILILAAWMLAEGQKAQAAYDQRSRAARPALPRKIIAACLCGAGIGLAAWGGAAGGFVLSLTLAILALGLHLVAFGLDPLKSKGQQGFGSMPGKRAARAIDQAEEHIEAMTRALDQLGDRKLSNRLDSLISSARVMFRTIEDDPRDLISARKYLGVYLNGARQATVKFSDLYQKSPEPAVRKDYEALLIDLEKNFDAQQKELLLDDQSDLDVEIDVLRERLRHEGVAN